MAVGSILCVILISGIIKSVYFSNEVPPEVEGPWKYNLIQGFVRIQGHINKLGELLGFDPRLVEQVVANTAIKLFRPGLPPDVKASNEVFDGVLVRLYEPVTDGQGRPGLLYMHGGGFRMGSPYVSEKFCIRLVQDLNIVIMSVDYRMVPQHIVPAAINDSRTAALYFFRNAYSMGVDSSKIGVAGDSAGANLASSVAMWLRDQGHSSRFAFQVVMYPFLQGLDLNLPSHVQNEKYVFDGLRRSGLAECILCYLGLSLDYIKYIATNNHTSVHFRNKYKRHIDWTMVPKKHVEDTYQRPELSENSQVAKLLEDGLSNPYNFPLMADSLADLPPAFVMTVEYDPLRDDGIIYAKRLEQDKVEVVHKNYKAGWHGMVHFMYGAFNLDVAHHATDDVVDFVSRICKK